jgi:hypothetical protein
MDKISNDLNLTRQQSEIAYNLSEQQQLNIDHLMNEKNTLEIKDKQLILQYNTLIKYSGKLKYIADYTIAVNRVLLSNSNILDTNKNKYGIYDGWAGTYWIQELNKIKENLE